MPRFSGETNDSLVDNMVASGQLAFPEGEAAMRQTDRANYCPTNPYQDCPQRITTAATISAPHMHAHAVHTLKEHLQPGMTVLDVGT